MKLSIRALSVAFAVSLPFSCSAQDCNEDIYVASQDELDNVIGDCTIINGRLFINDTYSGSLILNGVTNITNSLSVAGPDAAVPSADIASIELPDLQHITSIDLEGSSVTSFSAPRLTSVSRLWLDQPARGSEVDLRSVVGADAVTLRGNHSSINLESLEAVVDNLIICSHPGCFDGFGDDSTPDALNLTLSSLSSVRFLDIAARTSSVSMPNLARTNNSQGSTDMSIRLLETPGSITLPKVDYLDGRITMTGTISEIDLSSLHSADGQLTIETQNSLNINFPITRVDYLGFRGAIEGVDLPNLEYFEELDINSTRSLDCSPLEDQFGALEAEIEGENSGASATFNCRSASADGGSGSGLSTAARPTIGGVVSVVATTMVLGLVI
ncbi:hypothetical protein BDW62DRAFT_105773 [Aspergillus aurantiobrunneus]